MDLTALSLSNINHSLHDRRHLYTQPETTKIGGGMAVRTSCRTAFSFSLHLIPHLCLFKQSPSGSIVVRSVSGDGPQWPVAGAQLPPSDHEFGYNGSSDVNDGYLSMFIGMLRPDNDPLDREQAIDALWRYSHGGKQSVDSIMQFPGCLNLVVNLIKSESKVAGEAATGLLRVVSSFDMYKKSVAESGAIEAITALLSRMHLDADVKEQSISTLCNLSVDEDLRVKIANGEVLALLVRSLDDEQMKVKEVAGCVLSNLALSKSNHQIMVESGVIPKLANQLKENLEGSKVVRKEAKNALLELAKDDHYKLLIMEEGLIFVPLVGSAAYKSFRSRVHTWPSLPDGTKLERRAKGPSPYGASELLLGLSYDGESLKLDELQEKSKIAQTEQQFLVRIGAIETEYGQNPKSVTSSSSQFTLLPWLDGMARLSLILELEDESAICKAAKAIADASIRDDMRTLFKEAGAVKHLIRLLRSSSDTVRMNVISALEKLSFSTAICKLIEFEGALPYLLGIVKHAEVSGMLMDKTLDTLVRVLHVKIKLYDGSSGGVKAESSAPTTTDIDKDRILDKEIGISLSVESTTRSNRSEIFDSATIGRIVNIMKTSSRDLQRRAAMLLELIALLSSSVDSIVSSDIESALHAVFHIEQNTTSELQQHEAEQSSLAVASAAQLLASLLECEQFRATIDPIRLVISLCNILQSKLDLRCNNPVAACVLKLDALLGKSGDSTGRDVAVCRTIPQLVERIGRESDEEVWERDVEELGEIVSRGIRGSAGAVAAGGGIFALVKVVGGKSERAGEAALEVLYALSMIEENRSTFVAAGAVDVLRSYIHLDRVKWMLALRILRVLPIS